jgi:hypothetical protein
LKLVYLGRTEGVQKTVNRKVKTPKSRDFYGVKTEKLKGRNFGDSEEEFRKIYKKKTKTLA